MAKRRVAALHRQAATFAAVHSFRRAFSAFNRVLSTAAGNDMSLADMLALQYIAHGHDVTAGDLAKFTGLTSGSVSAMLDRLEAQRFVKRTRGAEDRRRVLIRLAPGALPRIMAIMVGIHEGVDRLFGDLNDKELATLTGLLERLSFEPGAAPSAATG
ncbi:MAG TPA: MarR family transcriptional regulator [Candidatus Thermoplasmatota archaeon]|nr:MarR family transcriptional regulator [Candidatus Thermoplasmatota archaeon]